MLSGQLREQFVTAAYLWLDTSARRARYSAAGHPPLLHWRAGSRELLRIESNGLLFGVSAAADYPVRELELAAGDRLLLYTDGLVEGMNAGGEEFGAARLEQVLRRAARAAGGSGFKATVGRARSLASATVAQQDDFT